MRCWRTCRIPYRRREVKSSEVTRHPVTDRWMARASTRPPAIDPTTIEHRHCHRNRYVEPCDHIKTLIDLGGRASRAHIRLISKIYIENLWVLCVRSYLRVHQTTSWRSSPYFQHWLIRQETSWKCLSSICLSF